MSIYKADKNGKAPATAKVGDLIETAGGMFKITGGSNGKFESVRLTDTPLSKSIYDALALNDAIAESNSARSQAMAREQMDYQTQSNETAMQFNAAQADINRDWQTQMSNTAHQREVADLQSAGLNPILSANNGASVGSGATATGSASSGATGTVDSNVMDLMKTVINAETELEMNKQSNLNNLQIADMNAKLGMFASENSLKGALAGAGAAYYGANLNYTNAQEQRDWNESHPTGPMGWLSWLVNNASDNPGANSPYGSGYKTVDFSQFGSNAKNLGNKILGTLAKYGPHVRN